MIYQEFRGFRGASRIQQDSRGLRRIQQDCRDPSMILEEDIVVLIGSQYDLRFQRILVVFKRMGSQQDLVGFQMSSRSQQDGILAGFGMIFEVLDFRGQQGLEEFQMSQRIYQDCRFHSMILGGFQRSKQDCRSVSRIQQDLSGLSRIQQCLRCLSRVLAGLSRILVVFKRMVLDYRVQQGVAGFQRSQKYLVELQRSSMILQE